MKKDKNDIELLDTATNHQLIGEIFGTCLFYLIGAGKKRGYSYYAQKKFRKRNIIAGFFIRIVLFAVIALGFYLVVIH